MPRKLTKIMGIFVEIDHIKNQEVIIQFFQKTLVTAVATLAVLSSTWAW